MDTNTGDTLMERWTAEKAAAWYNNDEWRVGCNYLPGTAVNQLEMWQKETFDPERIDLEFGWAEDLGFNLMRIYLHDLVWYIDQEGFISRIDQVLGLAEKHGIKVLLTLFDDCHRTHPVVGPQPLPVSGVHNCGWVMSPGLVLSNAFHYGTESKAERSRLRDYVTGVLEAFRDDSRVWMWDIYNEPGRNELENQALELLAETWEWARTVDVTQPLSSCLWGALGDKVIALNAENSDVINFHEYVDEKLEPRILEYQKAYGPRPLICTEYMAREHGTTFEHSLPILKKHNVAAINWGFVAGKSQTHFNWSSFETIEEKKQRGDVLRPGDPIPEPELWFHDILRMDGTPYRQEEVDFITSVLKE
jgi:hypothetical protein